MPVFQCKIGTADGRVLEREFEATDRQALLENLEEQGFFVFQIRRAGLRGLFGASGGTRLSGRRFLTLNQEMVVLIRSGLPILQVLDTLIERMEAGRLLEVLREIRSDVKGGGALSDAFARFPGMFPQLYVASLRAGEQSGDLPVTLARYITYQKRVEAIKAKVRSATFYPSLLAIAVVAVLTFLLLYVIPNVTKVYTDASMELPVLTSLVIGISNTLVATLPVWLPLLVAAGFALRRLAQTDRGGYLIDRWKLRLPFFGGLFNEYALSAFCRTLSTTLASGITVVQSMQMARGVLNNRLLEERMVAAIRKIQEGTRISDALEQTGTFPVLALRMISVGESSGSLGEMLTDVADYYEGEVERRLERLSTLVEPLMMLIMGLLVGGIVVAMYMPIFQLAGTVR
ncbi:MAG: type II secretion system F family protein [Deltaproteobacteria bacterium]|nr:MAG: type II secretion system F family protein [Deltaproteobacteria bacterium]